MSFRTRRSPVLVALSKKRSVLSRELIDLQKAYEHKQAEIMTLDATMKLLSIKCDMELARPRQKYTRTFEYGELKRLIIATLKKAKSPMTTREVTDEVCKGKELSKDYRHDVKRALIRYRVTVKVGENEAGAALWMLKAYAAKTMSSAPRLRLV